MGMRPTAPHNNSIPQQFSSLFTIRFSLFTSLVIQSEAMNLFLSLREIPHCVRNDKWTSKSIIHSGFQPSAEGLPCFPNAAHWAELTRPFRALTAVSLQICIPPLKGGWGDVHINVMTGEHRGSPLRGVPKWECAQPPPTTTQYLNNSLHFSLFVSHFSLPLSFRA